MTKQEYENEIKELRELLEKLEAEKIEEPQLKCWKPNEDEKYWAVANNGDIGSTYWDDDNYDTWFYLTGNYFKTKEEAEEYKKQIEYTARYKNYIEEHSEPLDWEDENQEKYCAEYGNQEKEITVYSYFSWKYQGTTYASSEEIIWDAIKEIGEDNFKKYVLGVK